MDDILNELDDLYRRLRKQLKLDDLHSNRTESFTRGQLSGVFQAIQIVKDSRLYKDKLAKEE